MKKIIFTLFVVFMSNVLTAQTQVFQFEEGKNYCTLEIDTTLAVDWGTFRSVEMMDVPYYEMTFTPKYELDESGKKHLVMIPTWHYYAYLAKVYGEVESADLTDRDFRLVYEFSEDGNVLTLKTTDAQRRVIYNRSSFSKKKHINFVGLPTTLTKVKEFNYSKFPKELRKDLEKRNNKIKSRLTQ